MWVAKRKSRPVKGDQSGKACPGRAGEEVRDESYQARGGKERRPLWGGGMHKAQQNGPWADSLPQGYKSELGNNERRGQTIKKEGTPQAKESEPPARGVQVEHGGKQEIIVNS